VGFFLGPLFYCIMYYVSLYCIMPISCCFDYYIFIVFFEVRQCNVFCSALFAQGGFGYSGGLWFNINFRIIFSSFMKNIIGILIGIALNL
jgi:hypothetical protein